MDYAERLKDESTWRDGWQTRDGRAVRILCCDMNNKEYPVVALVADRLGHESPQSLRMNGMFAIDECDSDLIPRPAKHTWRIVFKYDEFGRVVCSEKLHNVKQSGLCGPKYIACIPVTFTEGEGLS